MYVVILAGGGGTRLHPISTPERPKPFLPLLGERTLLQLTVDRLLDGPELRDRGLTAADVTVLAAGRYDPLVRQQLPGVAMLGEPRGRNTAAAIALATLAIDRPDDEVMIVLPADHRIEREATFRGVLAAAAGSIATGAFGIESPLVTLGIRRACRPIRSRPSSRSPPPTAPGTCSASRASPGTPACSSGAGEPSGEPSRRSRRTSWRRSVAG
jgi:mannose-1-phosphate guanylyltransferase